MAQVVPHPPACAPYGSSEYFTYGYQPSLATGIIFSIIFGVITIVQIQYMLRYRAWWMFFLVAGAGLDTLGWLGRAIAHDCVFSDTINTLQIATLIMGPGKCCRACVMTSAYNHPHSVDASRCIYRFVDSDQSCGGTDIAAVSASLPLDLRLC